MTAAEDEHVPLKGLRGKIAEQMLRSKQHSPHFTFVDECDVTELVALREQAKTLAAERGVKLTYLPFVMKALVAAFRKFPTLNALVDDTKGEFVIRKEYNIGIATDTDDGLTVPVVKHVDRRTILRHRAPSSQRAHRGRPRQEDRRSPTSRAARSRSRAPAPSAASSRRRSSTTPRSASSASTRSPTAPWCAAARSSSAR